MEDDTTTARQTQTHTTTKYDIIKKRVVMLVLVVVVDYVPPIWDPVFTSDTKNRLSYLWELWYSFWQRYTGMLQKMRAEYISTVWKAAARVFYNINGVLVSLSTEKSATAAASAESTSNQLQYAQKKVLWIPIRYSHLHSINFLFAEVKKQETTEKSVCINRKNDFSLTSFMRIMQCISDFSS